MAFLFSLDAFDAVDDGSKKQKTQKKPKLQVKPKTSTSTASSSSAITPYGRTNVSSYSSQPKLTSLRTLQKSSQIKLESKKEDSAVVQTDKGPVSVETTQATYSVPRNDDLTVKTAKIALENMKTDDTLTAEAAIVVHEPSSSVIAHAESIEKETNIPDTTVVVEEQAFVAENDITGDTVKADVVTVVDKQTDEILGQSGYVEVSKSEPISEPAVLTESYDSVMEKLGSPLIALKQKSRKTDADISRYEEDLYKRRMLTQKSQGKNMKEKVVIDSKAGLDEFIEGKRSKAGEQYSTNYHQSYYEREREQRRSPVDIDVPLVPRLQVGGKYGGKHHSMCQKSCKGGCEKTKPTYYIGGYGSRVSMGKKTEGSSAHKTFEPDDDMESFVEEYASMMGEAKKKPSSSVSYGDTKTMESISTPKKQKLSKEEKNRQKLIQFIQKQKKKEKYISNKNAKSIMEYLDRMETKVKEEKNEAIFNDQFMKNLKIDMKTKLKKASNM